MSVSRVSKDLGINENSLHNWKRAYSLDHQNAFPGKGRMKPEEEEISKLRKQLKRLEMERDILKKPSDTSQRCKSKVYVHKTEKETIQLKIAL